MSDKLDAAILAQSGGKQATTMSKDRIALLKIARITKDCAFITQADKINKILIEVGILSGKS